MTSGTLILSSCSGKDKVNEIPTTRNERNFVKSGNKHYANKDYAKSEIDYRKALAENTSSDVAKYNLASALSHIEEAKTQSDSLFIDVAKTAVNIDAAQHSFYNLGNESYRKEDYQGSIAMYKDALRRNPLDDNARENLRLAQLKLQEQQQNQDQQQQDQQQDQQQEQQQEQQQQEQNQQNQDKNDQEQQQNQDQQQDQDQQQQQGNKKPDNNERDREDKKQGGMSQSNAQQILQAMEKEENATRRRVEAQQKADRERNSQRRTVDKPW